MMIMITRGRGTLQRTPTKNQPQTGRSGFTLVEVSVVLLLLSTAAVALLSTLAKLPLLDKAQEEEIVALQAAQTKLEELHLQADLDFASLWIRFNSTNLDDPTDGVSPGSRFVVEGLKSWPEDGEFCGAVVFPETEGVLDETVDWGSGGHEIDGEPGMDNQNVDPEDYHLLPVRVEIRYISMVGYAMTKTLETAFYGPR